MWDAVAGLPVGSAPAFVAGGVGNIGTVLRIDEKKVVVVHARPFDPESFMFTGYVAEDYVLGAEEIDLYLSTAPYMSFPTDTPASTRFEAVLERAYEFEASLFSGDEIGARSLPSLGDGIVDNRDDKRDFYQRLNFAGRDWRVFVGDQFDQFASFFEVWPGKAGSPELERDRIVVPLEDIGKRFDQPMQIDLYTPGFEPSVIGDGVNNIIDFGNVLNQGSAGFTIGTAFLTSTQATAFLYGRKVSVGGAGAGFSLGLGSGGAVRLDISDGSDTSTATFNPPGGYNDGQRHTLVGSWRTGIQLLELYYDGVLVATASTAAVGSLSNAVNLTALASGGAASQHFNGQIERLAFHNIGGPGAIDNVQSALDERFADDVDADGLGLAHYVPMTENTLFTVTDTSSSGFNGTISGAADSNALWTGTPNGTLDLDGTILPQSFGFPFHVEPDLIDGAKYVFRMHDGSIDDVVQVFDGGVELFEDASATGDIFTGSGPAAGEYQADLTRGLVRLGSKPEGRVTVTLRGDNAPTWTDNPAEILRRIANRKLEIPDPQGFDQEAFAEFDGSRGVSLYNSHREGMTFAQAFDRLMRPRGWWAIGRTGLVTVGQLRVVTSPQSEIGDDDIVAGTLKRVSEPPVHWRDRVGYGRRWTVASEGELLLAVDPPGGLDRIEILTQALRFVSDQDESLRNVFLDAIDVTNESEIITKDNATLELTDVRDLFARKTEVWQMRLATGVLQYWLGDEVRMKTQRYNLFDRVFYVVGVQENINTGVLLTVWGAAE